MGNLIIASNRGPFTFSEDFLNQTKDCLEHKLAPEALRFGDGGLVQAMAGLLKPNKGFTIMWLSTPLGDKDLDVVNGQYDQLFKSMYEEGYAPHTFPYISLDENQRINFEYGDHKFYMGFVPLDKDRIVRYYNGFSNDFLWPLIHLARQPLYQDKKEFPKPRFDENDFLSYISVGDEFAKMILDETMKSEKLWKNGQDFVVWIQDYHLMPVSDIYKVLLLKQGVSEEDRKRIHIGQFMHTPFFNIEVVQDLIEENKTIEDVLKKLTYSMLSNDFIGFHTHGYCHNFMNALQEWFPVRIEQGGNLYKVIHSNGVTTLGAFPIGVDVDKILSEVSPEKSLEYQLGEENLIDKIKSDKQSGKYVFGGLDRCDYTKGLIDRLRIFQHTLNNLRGYEKFTESDKRDARLYQVTAPSRRRNVNYQNFGNLLEQEVKKSNDEIKGDDEAIVHIGTGIFPPHNYRLMKEIDVMLVTPLEDGMNIVAMEYILSQKYKNPSDRGILVLGNCGAAQMLRNKGFDQEDGIIYIDPTKIEEAGERITQALMKDYHISERVIGYIENEHRIGDWAQSNIDAIVNCRKAYATRPYTQIPLMGTQQIAYL